MAFTLKGHAGTFITAAGASPKRFTPAFSHPSCRTNAQRRVPIAPIPWGHTAEMQAPATPHRNVTAKATGLLASKTQQSNAYGALTAVYGLLALATTFAPGQLLSAVAAAAATPLNTCLMLSIAGHVWVLLAAAKCLQEAADHDRLASDTYKRLNLAIFYQSIFLGVQQIRHKAMLSTELLGASAMLLLPTAFVAARVYTLSNGEVFSLPAILKGFFAGVRDCFTPKNFTSGIYAVSAVLALVGALVLLSPDSLSRLVSSHVTAFGQYLTHCLGALRFSYGVCNYIQKDAADRGRLGAGTFKKLNLALAVARLSQAWLWYELTPLGIPVDRTVQMAVIGWSLLCAGVCVWQYFNAKK